MNTSVWIASHPRDPFRNVAYVEVVGRLGTFRGIRKDLSLGIATAQKYARLLDAPRSVFETINVGG